MKIKTLMLLVLLVTVACGRFENSAVTSGADLPTPPAPTALDGGDVIRNGDSTGFGSDSSSPYSDVLIDDLKHHLNDQKALKQYRGFKDRNAEERLI